MIAMPRLLALVPRPLALAGALAVVAALGFAACLSSYRPGVWSAPDVARLYVDPAPFTYARRMRWILAPVAPLSDDEARAAAAPLPAAHGALLKALGQDADADAASLGARVQSAAGGALLARYLAAHPRDFYAEYLMSVRYSAAAADAPLRERWLARSLRDAPAVVAQRLQLFNGRAVPRYRGAVTLEYASAAASADDQPVAYPEFLTDDHGCFYLPAYTAPAQESSWGTVSGGRGWSEFALLRRAASWDSLMTTFWFRPPGRGAGLLPAVVLRPYVAVSMAGAARRMASVGMVYRDDFTARWRWVPGAANCAAYVGRVSLQDGSVSKIDYSASGSLPQGDALKPLSFALTPKLRAALKPGALYALSVSFNDASDTTVAETQPVYFRAL